MIDFQPLPNSGRFRDLTGQVFNMLTVLGYAGSDKRNKGLWHCKCECGATTTIRGDSFHRNPQSCGCLIPSTTKARATTHGYSDFPEYAIWCAMRQRCLNPNQRHFASYGGRGIDICPQWDSFEVFISDIGFRPSPELTLERIDNDKGYSPENCKWATRAEQARNTRDNLILEFNGVTQGVYEWSVSVGIPVRRIRLRKNKGWCDECALFLPFRKHCPHKFNRKPRQLKGQTKPSN